MLQTRANNANVVPWTAAGALQWTGTDGLIRNERETRNRAETQFRKNYSFIELINVVSTSVYLLGIITRMINVYLAPLVEYAAGFVMPIVTVFFNATMQFGSAGVLQSFLLGPVFGVSSSVTMIGINAARILLPGMESLCTLPMCLCFAAEGVLDELTVSYYSMDTIHNQNKITKARFCIGLFFAFFIGCVRLVCIISVYSVCSAIIHAFVLWHVIAFILWVFCFAFWVINVYTQSALASFSAYLEAWNNELLDSPVPFFVFIPSSLVVSVHMFQWLLVWPCSWFSFIGSCCCDIPMIVLPSFMGCVKYFNGMKFTLIMVWFGDREVAPRPANTHLLSCVFYPVNFWMQSAKFSKVKFDEYNAAPVNVTSPLVRLARLVREQAQAVTATCSKIPLLLQRVHNAGLVGLYSQNASEGNNLDAGLDLNNETARNNWACRRCSYFNEERRAECLLCGTVKTSTRNHVVALAETLRTQLTLPEARNDRAFALRLQNADTIADTAGDRAVAERLQEEMWDMDAYTDAVLRDMMHVLGVGAEDANIAVPNPEPQVNPVVAAVLRRNPQGPVRHPANVAGIAEIDFRNLVNHGQNVHNAVIEAPAIESIAEFVRRPLPAGMDAGLMLQQLMQAIR
jgi:hypothetical protein